MRFATKELDRKKWSSEASKTIFDLEAKTRVIVEVMCLLELVLQNSREDTETACAEDGRLRSKKISSEVELFAEENRRKRS